jgi:hypothetical protein
MEKGFMKHLLRFIILLSSSLPSFATEYYAVLVDTATHSVSAGSNSDANTSIGYNTHNWPSEDKVNIVENLEELMVIMEADSSSPHILHLWHGVFDDPGDYLRIDALNTELLTVIGQGDNTILDGTNIIENYAVLVNGRSGVTFKEFKIRGGREAFFITNQEFSQHARNITSITISSVTMENQSVYGVRVFCDEETHTNFTLSDSIITDDDADVVGVRFHSFSDCSINNVKIKDNTFLGLHKGVQFISSESSAGLYDSSPYDILIEGNKIIDTYHLGIGFQSGLKSNTGTTSYIRNNYLEDIGDVASPHVNAIQLNWCHDLVVENNIINGVLTSAPDGHGIIADFAWRNNDYLSDGIIIRNNTIHGLNSLNCDRPAFSAGINVYKATNTLVYDNVSYDNCVGYKLTRPQSTGSYFFNNIAHSNRLSSVRLDLGAPSSFWRNNLFDGRGVTPYGVFIDNTGSDSIHNTTYPAMYDNVFYDHTIDTKLYGWISQPIGLDREW